MSQQRTTDDSRASRGSRPARLAGRGLAPERAAGGGGVQVMHAVCIFRIPLRAAPSSGPISHNSTFSRRGPLSQAVG